VLLGQILDAGLVDAAMWENRIPDMIAGPDAIRNLHLGNPEAIQLDATGAFVGAVIFDEAGEHPRPLQSGTPKPASWIIASSA
jgi:hypothetical protein